MTDCTLACRRPAWRTRCLIALARLSILLFVAGSSAAEAATYYSRANGNWTANNTWSTTGCGGANAGSTPGAADDVIICNNRRVTANAAGLQAQSVSFEAGANPSWLRITANDSLTVNGDVTIVSATAGGRDRRINLTGNNATLTVTGNVFLNAGGVAGREAALRFTADNGTINIQGNLVLDQAGARFDLGLGGADDVNTATVQGNVTVNNGGLVRFAGDDSTLNVQGNLSVAAGGTVDLVDATSIMTVQGNLVLDGTLDNGPGGRIDLEGNFTHNGTYADASGTFRFTGAGAQALGGSVGTTEFYDLVMAKTGGDLNLGHDVDIDNTLTLTTGRISTSVNRVYIMQGSTLSGGGTGSYVEGNLRRYVAAGDSTLAYPVGGAASGNYAPVSIAFTNVTTAGDYQAASTDGEHAQIATSGLDAARSVNRYWTLSNFGVAYATTMGALGYADPTFSFLPADLDGGALPASFEIARRDGGSWHVADPGTLGASATQALYVTAVGEFALGNYAASTRVAEYRMDQCTGGLPAGNDSGPNGLDGAVVGGVSLVNPGKLCTGSAFNGTTGYINVPDNAPMNVLTQRVAVAAWVRHSGAFKNWEAIVSKGDSAFRMHLNGGCTMPNQFNNYTAVSALHFGLNGGCANADLSSGIVPVNGTWYHLLGTYDGARIRIYVDGVLRNWADLSTAIGTNGFDFRIAENAQQTGRHWTGDIDEVVLWNRAISRTEGIAHRDQTRTCCFDHLRIEHDGIALTCQPETVTVKACKDSGCTGLYAGGVTGTLTPAGWVGGDAVNVPGGGSTTKALRQTGVGAATLGATGITPAPASATVCYNTATTGTGCTNALDFRNSGFIFDVPDLTSCKTSASVTITAVRKDDTSQKCVPAFESGVRSVNFWSTYSNPASGGQQVEVNGGAVATASPGTGVSLTFVPGATSSFTVRYPDAGQMLLNARYNGVGAETGLVMEGMDGFTAAPVGLAVYASASCPAGDASCPVFAKAGESFTLNVKAACWTSDADTDLSDNPATENFELAGIPLTHTLIAPTGAGTDPGTLGLTSVTFGPGDNGLRPLAQTVSEVGVFTFTATPGANAYLGLTVPGGTSPSIGRFRPDHFALTAAGTLAPGCSSATPFSYLGQPFSFSGLTLQARAVGGSSETKNYTGGFAKHTPGTFAAWGFGACDNCGLPGGGGTALGSRIDPGAVVSGAWSNGLLNAGINPFALNRQASNTPDGPFAAARIGIAPTDIDGTALGAAFLNLDADRSGANERAQIGASTALRFGRLDLDNAAGSDNVALPVQLETQYWNGGAFQRNSDDSCTSLPRSAIVLDDRHLGVVACNTWIQQDPVAFAAGSGTLYFEPPNDTGSVRLTPNLGLAPAGTYCNGAVEAAATAANRRWLQGRWIGGGAAYDDNPSARASFGLYGAQPKEFIFFRENY